MKSSGNNTGAYLGTTNLSLDPIIENYEEESRGKYSTGSRKGPTVAGDKEEIDFNISSVRSKEDDDLYSPDILKTRAQDYLKSDYLEDSLYGELDKSNGPKVDGGLELKVDQSVDVGLVESYGSLKISPQPFEKEESPRRLKSEERGGKNIPASAIYGESMHTVQELEEIDQELKLDMDLDKKLTIEQKKDFLQLKVNLFLLKK